MNLQSESDICFETIIAGGWPIILRQAGPDDFSVQYGQQLRASLSYAAAARELGEAIMHALACEDRLDNRTAGETRP